MEYPKVNTINLSHRVDRYENIQKQFSEQGIIDFKIWPGIIDPMIKQRGVSQAHKQIVRWAATLNLPEVCIMEDDCEFLGKGAFEYFIANKPQQYKLYLGGLSNGKPDVNNMLKDFRAMTLYMVSQSFYNEFLSVDERQNIDYALSRLKHEYHVCPKIVCTQLTGFSDNKKGYFSYSHLLKQYDIWNP